MGTWGTALFSNDDALDARDTYESLLAYGKTPEEAERLTIQDLEMNDPLCDPNLWFGLAYAEWRCGRVLSDMVKDKAIELIDNGGDLDLWESARDRAKREKALAKLREQLTSPLPKPKRIARIKPNRIPWEVGDIIAIPLPTSAPEYCVECPHLNGKYALIQVADIIHCSFSKYQPDNELDDYPMCIVYYWWGDDLNQACEALRNPRIAYMGSSKDQYRPILNMWLASNDKGGYGQYKVIAHADVSDIGLQTQENSGDNCQHIQRLPDFVYRWLSKSVPRPLTGVKSVEWLL